MDIITWIFVGLVAGMLASFVSRDRGFGLVGDTVLGIVGAVVGTWGFRELRWHSPIQGLPGVIFVAFIGAVAVLFAARLVPRTRV